MTTPGSRIRTLRKADGLTLKAAVRGVGITPQALSQIERGETRMPTVTVLDALCDARGWDRDEILYGHARRKAAAPPQEWRDILGYKVAASLGRGIRPDEYAETHKLKFRAYSLNKMGLHASSLGICYGRGDSMLPRIHDGDAILFDTSDVHPLKDGRLYVIDLGDAEGLVAKRVTEIAGTWYMEALNTNADGWAKPRPLDLPRNGGRIVGRVRWIGSWEP